jgi:hypothetical protein
MRCTCEQASREARREALEEAAFFVAKQAGGLNYRCDDADEKTPIKLIIGELARAILTLRDKPETK